MENRSLIYELNNQEAIRLIPIISCLLIICILGLCGNGLSLYIFTTRFQKSNSRLFFIYLSVVELFACLVLIPFDVIAMFKQLVFTSDLLCVSYIFTLIFEVSIAADILVVIAIDRWRKICHPFQWQLSYKVSVFLCLFNILAGFVYSLPSLWLYGVHTVQVQIADFNISGHECSINDSSRNTVYPLLYNIFFWFITTIRITLCAVIYTRIMITVGKHDKKTINKYKADSTPQPSNHELIATEDDLCDERPDICSDILASKADTTDSNRLRCPSVGADHEENGSLYSLSMSITDREPNESCDKRNDTHLGLLSQHRGNDNHTNEALSSIVPNDDDLNTELRGTRSSVRSSGKPWRSGRSRTVTIVMLTVTITSVVIYMPYLVLASLRAVVKDFEHALSTKERVVYKFFIRSYFLKAVVNPVVYGIFDPRFRQAVKCIVKRCCNK